MGMPPAASICIMRLVPDLGRPDTTTTGAGKGITKANYG
jgi:hypothetical protein